MTKTQIFFMAIIEEFLDREDSREHFDKIATLYEKSKANYDLEGFREALETTLRIREAGFNKIWEKIEAERGGR